MRSLRIEPCEAPAWASSGHLQTLFGYFLPSAKLLDDGRKTRIPLPDGDFLVGRISDGANSTVVVLFHGLTGCIESNYMVRTANLAAKLGNTVLRVNHRDCGEGYGLANNPYHAGRGEDISAVVDFCRVNFPGKRIVAVGFSLGANALLNLLCGRRGQSQPDFGICVNAPVDLRACSEKLSLGLNKIYDYKFVTKCRRELLAKAKDGRLEFKPKISKFAQVSDIDNIYTAPMSGFIDANDYYAQCSTYKHFAEIRTPTLLLMAKDDPFVTWEPYLKANSNPNVHLHLEERGGHLGYLSQKSLGRKRGRLNYKRWLDDAITEALTSDF